MPVRATLVPSASASSSASTPDKKRKRDTSTEALWAALQETDARAAKHRRKVLDTWSSKTRNATVEVKSRNLISSQQSLVASLEDQLLNSDRLIKRARTPRSCAPVQVAAKVNEDASVSSWSRGHRTRRPRRRAAARWRRSGGLP
ncbi:bfr-2 [Verticillium alfalfae VaMs.102]|uniref:Bfr-2 n=1 Tax=Verticillium alfalfae (strain VaMs.102 / ATCC MYA-4576 / FGSC 10136) TaxID=526221 RepID=C9SWJ3_VERA1|nr:bfr-2 [Verticillium alfalfae VaMs.102]EEY23158.1 bfr-2 [Verticillium alfalfae VaMs.102]